MDQQERKIDKTRTDSQSRQQEAFRTMLEIVSEKGMAGISTSEVAKRMNVSQPALYRYFKDRDEMILFFVQTLANRLQQMTMAAGDIEDPQEKILFLYRKHFEMMQKYPGLPGIILSDALQGASEGAKKVMYRATEEYRKQLADIIREGMEKGIFRPVHPEVTVHFILGSMISAMAQKILSAKREIRNQQAFEKNLIALLT